MGLKRKRHIMPINFTFDNVVLFKEVKLRQKKIKKEIDGWKTRFS